MANRMVSLTQFNIQRPEKIIYDFPLSNPDNVINCIKSKSLRSFLLKTDEVLKKNNIDWKYEDLTEQKFIEWLPYYKERMEERHFDVRAKEEWYQEQIKKGFNIKSLFLYQKNNMVGSAIITLKDNIASLAYKASDRMIISSMPGSSFGSVIEFLVFKLVSESGNFKVATSRSRNAFGFFNTLGYLDFRLRFGYTPRPNLVDPLQSDVPANEKGAVLFYGLQNEKFILFALQPKSQRNDELFNINSFTSSEIPFKQIYY
jgi:hypothetical protein